MYEIWYDYMKLKYAEKANLWIWMVLLCIQKQKTFAYILQKILKRDLILQIMNYKDYYLKI